MPFVAKLAALLLVLPLAQPAAAASDFVNGQLIYKGITVDVTLAENAPNRDAIEESLKKQIDIVDGCGAKPEIMAFFRAHKLKLKFGHGDGGGHFSAAGIEIEAAPQPPEKPIVLHELLHALHAQYLPNGVRNADVLRFYNNAVRGKLYLAGEYVLKNNKEFFAVTASLYLSGFVARAPNDRETLRAKQPRYYEWLAQLFGVKK